MDRSEPLSRRWLDESSDAVARGLQASGVRQGDIVTIILPNGPDHHLAAFAIWKLGATPAPVSHRLPQNEIDAIVEVSEPRVVVALPGVTAGGRLVVTVDDLRILAPEIDLVRGLVAPYLKATTSGGSTGRPKVIVDHLPSMADPECPWLGMEVDDVVLHPAPLYHNAPFIQTNLAMCFGCHVIEMSRFDPVEWLRLVDHHKVRWTYLVPTMMHRIMTVPKEERDRFDVSSLEFVVHMASMCPTWLKAAWIEWLGPDVIWEVYAGTEAIGGTVINGRDWLRKPGSVGTLWAGEALTIVDDEGRPLPTGEVGDIRFTPPPGPARYHYLGAESNAAHGTDTYGDMGWLDEDGFLFIADRRTDMVTVGGVNVYPAEVEAVLDSHPKVGSSLVVGLPDLEMGNRVHAVIQPSDPEGPPEASELQAFLAERLVSYKRPRTFELVTERLRDDAGKARRSQFRESRSALWAEGERFVSLVPDRG